MEVYCTKGKGFYALTAAELQLEILERKKLIDQCVGRLYPAIIWSEIKCIHARIDEIQKATRGRNGHHGGTD